MKTQIKLWACEYLESHGYVLKTKVPEEIQLTPWSYVVRFDTSAGFIYLKSMPESIALEASIIAILRDHFQASVPKLIAQNTELHCFLMHDAGRTLRSILKQQFDEALLFKAINQFTSLQIAVADKLDVLLEIGVPDWRLDKLPDLYKQLIAQKEVLRADGLTEDEINKLETLHVTVANLCEKLSKYHVKHSFVQPDFNDNNTLINDNLQTITIIDLGEIAVSHPFFSLINLVLQMEKHHGLTEQDDRYTRIKEACFENYLQFESKQNLSYAFSTAQILFPIYKALADYRLMLACDKNLFTPPFQGQGRLDISLKEFIRCKFS